MDDRGTPASDIDESAPTYPRSFSGYIASKSLGEAAVLAANGPGFRTIALRPPALWGPGGPFSKQLPHAIESGQFAFIGRGEYPASTIHVDNVVEAVQCALERGTGRAHGDTGSIRAVEALFHPELPDEVGERSDDLFTHAKAEPAERDLVLGLTGEYSD